MSFSTLQNPRSSRKLLVLLLASALAAGSADAAETPTAEASVRGAYLARRVALCEVCHSQRDWSLYSGPPVPGSERAGGVVGLFGSREMAPPIAAENLVDWSVETLAAALRGGAPPSGGRMHQAPLLTGLADLTAGDAHAVASYLKSPTRPDLPTAIEALPSTATLLGVTAVEAGAYLVRIARCATCHGEDLSGGRQIEIPGGISLPSANLTPHPTAIGRMSRDEFIDYFRSLSDPALERLAVPEGETNTAMPWPWLARMSPEDLGAIYDYLATFPSIPAASAPTTP